MKKILLSFVFLFASLNLNAQFVDPPDGVVTHLINGAYVVDNIYYNTIQQAITAAGTTGIVEIPSNYTGTDTYTNPHNITIFDYRAGNSSYLNGNITVLSDPTLAYQLTTKHYVDGSIAGITGAKGSPGGYASLDSNGYVLASEIPSMAITQTFVVTSTTLMLALNASVGDVAIVNTGNTATNASYILQSLPATTLANWILLTTPDTGVITINGLVGNVNLGFSNINGSVGCSQLPALTGDITSAGCATTAGGNVALLNGANTFTNNQTINISGAANTKWLNITQPNLSAGGSSSISFGVNTSNYNNAYLSFNYAGTGSASNQIGIGIGGAFPLVIGGNSAVSWGNGAQITSSTNVCQTSGTGCPAGLIASNYAQLAATNNAFTGSMNVNGGINVGTTATWSTGSAINITGSNPGLLLTDTETTPKQWGIIEGITAVNNGVLGFYNVNNGYTPILMFPSTGDVVVGYRSGTLADNNSALTVYAQANNSAAEFSGSNVQYTNIGLTNTTSGQGVALFQIGTTSPIGTWPVNSAVLEAGTDGGSGAALVLDAYGANSIIFQSNRVNTAILNSGGAFNTAGNISAPYIFSTGASEPPASDGTQGAYILWNSNPGGTGSTNFVNLEGGGAGGFTWQNGANTSALTQLMSLTPAGALYTLSSISANGSVNATNNMSVTSAGSDAYIALTNTGGGRNWWLDSGGNGSGIGAGNICLYDASAGTAAFCISAAHTASFSSMTVNNQAVCLADGVGCPIIRTTATIAIPTLGSSTTWGCNNSTVSFPGLISGMVISGSIWGGGGSSIMMNFWFDASGVAGVTTCGNTSAQSFSVNLIAQ